MQHASTSNFGYNGWTPGNPMWCYYQFPHRKECHYILINNVNLGSSVFQRMCTFPRTTVKKKNGKVWSWKDGRHLKISPHFHKYITLFSVQMKFLWIIPKKAVENKVLGEFNVGKGNHTKSETQELFCICSISRHFNIAAILYMKIKKKTYSFLA